MAARLKIIIKIINPVQSKNRARPMAARLIIIINPVKNKNRARPMAARLIITIINPVQSKTARPMAARLKSKHLKTALLKINSIFSNLTGFLVKKVTVKLNLFCAMSKGLTK